MRSLIFLKLLASFVLIIVVATLVMDFAITRAWEQRIISNAEVTTRQAVELLAERIDDSSANLQQIVSQTAQSTGARVTVIQHDGTVLSDSEANPAEMENHATRPEFQNALHGAIGSSIRHSHTVGIDFLYVAAPTNNGAARVAYPLREIDAAKRNVHAILLRSSLAAFAIALVLAFISAQAIARRVDRILRFADEVAEGHLGARLADNSNDELGHVAFALNRTAESLQHSFEEVDQSRRDLEAVLNSMQEGVLAVEPDLRVLWTNNRLASLLPGKVRREHPVAETIRDPGILDALARCVRDGEVVTTRADSAVPGRIMSVTAAPLPNRGAVAVMFDITDFERVEKTRRDFIANVSHELRTPLTSVQGYSETLLEGSTPPEMTREFLEVIRKNSTRMVRLTEDLLTLAKVESGETKPKLQPIAAAELLSDAHRYWQESHRDSDFVFDTKSASTRTVIADRDAILQVFSNLIENAWKYAASGGRMEIGSFDVDDMVAFYVRDFGQGIPSEHLPRLFERFYRIDRNRSRETGGTGLGLAICKHIIRVHGGTIRAESELGRGSSFIFTLPVASRIDDSESLHHVCSVTLCFREKSLKCVDTHSHIPVSSCSRC